MGFRNMKKRAAETVSIAVSAVLVTLAIALPAHAAWPLWNDFVAANVEESRVVDRSDSRRITTSEGQSYALFFALVANDPVRFDAILDWTEKNLSGGDITKTLPAWLWGRTTNGSWGVLDTNNATDSDMWIAYALLEAGRIWERKDLTAKGLAMMGLLKAHVREVENLGSVLLPGRVGFEDKNGTVKLNPSYYPLFILRRFAAEDAFWARVYDGSLAMLVRSAPSGFSPEWARFTASGRLVKPEGEDCGTGSYNAIRTYMWAGMLSPADPSRTILARQFAPMVAATRALNFPPEKTNVATGDVSAPGPDYFGACLLTLLGNDRTAGLIRTVLTNEGVNPERYYGNVLTLFGLGFDEGRWGFAPDGRLILEGGGGVN
ncbi:cellulose synthase complex periplasmic endoglucanase BcsZ [Sutterella sp.]|uniref:cellulose synthase complex periplasmic endoglucanase BcsZ n=1 Tax=Sutterella sp. TaxID=1981025 RepID=UPI0026E0E385|nr:cellulose synthase complex periplasmic endoglucanase BcsZ [Sutterella sp.]MDO5532101.1 cellulose synthase complex periplasmic endoglucanase BcsZ [Sutterella sp.]